MAKTVKVGCRMPGGVRLQVSDWVKGADGNQILKPIAIYDIAGSGRHIGAVPGGLHNEDDATFTEIPADHWEKWYEMNKDSDLVTSGTVFKGTARAATDAGVGADPVQAEAEAQREILGEQVSTDPKADADAAKRASKTAKTL